MALTGCGGGMLAWAKALFDERMKDCLLVALPNGAVVAMINLVQLNGIVTLLIGLASLAYIAWRWRRDSFVVCEGCRNGHIPSVCPLPPARRPWWRPKRL